LTCVSGSSDASGAKTPDKAEVYSSEDTKTDSAGDANDDYSSEENNSSPEKNKTDDIVVESASDDSEVEVVEQPPKKVMAKGTKPAPKKVESASDDSEVEDVKQPPKKVGDKGTKPAPKKAVANITSKNADTPGKSIDAATGNTPVNVPGTPKTNGSVLKLLQTFTPAAKQMRKLVNSAAKNVYEKTKQHDSDDDE